MSQLYIGDLEQLLEILKVTKNYKRNFTYKDSYFISAYDTLDDDEDDSTNIILQHNYKDLYIPENFTFFSKDFYGYINTHFKAFEALRKKNKVKPKESSYQYIIEEIDTDHWEIKVGYMFKDEESLNISNTIFATERFRRDKRVLKEFVDITKKYVSETERVSVYYLEQDFIDKIIDSDIIYYYEFNHLGENLNIALGCSIFKRKKYDDIQIAIKSTVVPEIVNYTLYLTKGKVKEVLSGYTFII